MPSRPIVKKRVPMYQLWYSKNEGAIIYWRNVIKTLLLLIVPSLLSAYILHKYSEDFTMSLVATLLAMYAVYGLVMTVMTANAE